MCPLLIIFIALRFDALFNAFHVDTIPTLLPYVEEYDSESIYYSQVQLIHLAQILYPNQVIQFNCIGMREPSTKARIALHYLTIVLQ